MIGSFTTGLVLRSMRANTFSLRSLSLQVFHKRTLTKGVIASKGPFDVSLVEGKRYSWCQCGFSEKQPFCDGQHKKKAPGISPVRFKAEKTDVFYLCGCKQTKTAPYCDGTHLSDEVQNAMLNTSLE